MNMQPLDLSRSNCLIEFNAFEFSMSLEKNSPSAGFKETNCKENMFCLFLLALIPPLFFVLKMSAFYVCCVYSSALQKRFFHGNKRYEP